MSLRRLLLVGAAVLLTLPTAALADGVNFGFTGGALDGSGLALTTSGGGSPSTLNFVGYLPGGMPQWTGNLGTVSLSTGNFISNCGVGGFDTCYAAAGSSIQIIATTAFAPGITAGTALFSGAFVDVASALFAGGPLPPGPLPAGTGAVFSSVTCDPSIPAGTTCFRLYGTISGTLDPALMAALGLTGGVGANGWIAQIDFTFTSNPGMILNIAHGDAQVVVPEPATLALFGTGLLGIAGLMRRRLRS